MPTSAAAGTNLHRVKGVDRHMLTRRSFIEAGCATLAGSMLAGCGGSGTEPVARPALTARPGSPTVDAELGLSPLGLDPVRDGLLYVPESYTPSEPLPLFIALHGAGGAPGNWASYQARAEERRFVLLVPASRARTWDLLLGRFGPDVAFLDRALSYTFERVAIAHDRIALGGFSDGASYALSLGVSNGDLFTHLVAYSPGVLDRRSPTDEQPRILVSHGVADDILPVSASRNQIVPELEDAGYDVTYFEFDAGHTVPAQISEAALDWFLA